MQKNAHGLLAMFIARKLIGACETFFEIEIIVKMAITHSAMNRGKIVCEQVANRMCVIAVFLFAKAEIQTKL